MEKTNMFYKARLSACLVFLFVLSGCTYPKDPQRHNYDKPVSYKEKLLDSTRGYLNEMRACYDVRFYDLDLAIFPEKKAISGHVKMIFDVVSTTQKIQLEAARELDIASITDESGKELRFERSGRAVYVFFENPLQAGTRTFIYTSYSGRPQIAEKPPWRGGMVWKKSEGMPFAGVACEDDGASIWWPLKDHISDKPDSVRTSFDVPADLFCVSNGRLISETETGQGRKKFIWQTSYPINQYNVTFYLGDYRHFQIDYDNETGNHPLDFYVLPENYDKAKKHFRQTIYVLEAFERLFGEYPWWKDGFKMVESPYAGMEHQTAIAYGSGYKNGKWIDYDYILVHETAHEWWGNAVTVCDMADLWLHEGFATYAEALYMEAIGEKLSYDVLVSIDRTVCKNRYPVVGPKDVAYSNYRDGDIYSKGAVTLHTLRTVINQDSVFFKILYRFGTEYRNACVTTQDFIDLVNDESGTDYTWLFSQLIYRREAPELCYYLNCNGSDCEFVYQWNPENTNPDFKMPVELTMAKKKHVLIPSTQIQRITLKNANIYPVHIDNWPFYILTEDKALRAEN